MSDRLLSRRLSRRGFLKAGGAGVLTFLAGNALSKRASAATYGRRPPILAGVTEGRPRTLAAPLHRRLAASDGYITLPGLDTVLLPSGELQYPGGQVYIFGFQDVPLLGNPNDPNDPGQIGNIITAYKGNAQMTAPIIAVDEGTDFSLGLINLGLAVRIDLTDAHTIHWHGFPNQIPLMDGVPQVSPAVPIARELTYFFHPVDPGTYIYHCHFEDTEHVQMAFVGSVYVRPALGPKFAYNDPSTAFDREYTMLLMDMDTQAHWNDEHIQETDWTEFKPNEFTMNGRCYPQTILPGGDPSLPHQPISSLVQCNPGETVLLRFANLGYAFHTMEVVGVPFKVIGEDATILRGGGGTGVDVSYFANSVRVGPGLSRDCLFTAPAFDGGLPTAADSVGTYNTYLLRNRNLYEQTNNGQPGLGGMVTQVRVYSGGPVPAQTHANQTYPEFV